MFLKLISFSFFHTAKKSFEIHKYQIELSLENFENYLFMIHIIFFHIVQIRFEVYNYLFLTKRIMSVFESQLDFHYYFYFVGGGGSF